MARITHPAFPEVGMDVPDGVLAEWVAAGWVPEGAPDNNEAGDPGEEE